MNKTSIKIVAALLIPWIVVNPAMAFDFSVSSPMGPHISSRAMGQIHFEEEAINVPAVYYAQPERLERARFPAAARRWVAIGILTGALWSVFPSISWTLPLRQVIESVSWKRAASAVLLAELNNYDWFAIWFCSAGILWLIGWGILGYTRPNRMKPAEKQEWYQQRGKETFARYVESNDPTKSAPKLIRPDVRRSDFKESPEFTSIREVAYGLPGQILETLEGQRHRLSRLDAEYVLEALLDRASGNNRFSADYEEFIDRTIIEHESSELIQYSYRYPNPYVLKRALLRLQSGYAQIDPKDKTNGAFQRQIDRAVQNGDDDWTKFLNSSKRVREGKYHELETALYLMAENPSVSADGRVIKETMDRLLEGRLKLDSREYVLVVDPYTWKIPEQSVEQIGILPREIAELVGATAVSAVAFVQMTEFPMELHRSDEYLLYVRALHKKTMKAKITTFSLSGTWNYKALLTLGKNGNLMRVLKDRVAHQLQFKEGYQLRGEFEYVPSEFAPVGIFKREEDGKPVSQIFLTFVYHPKRNADPDLDELKMIERQLAAFENIKGNFPDANAFEEDRRLQRERAIAERRAASPYDVRAYGVFPGSAIKNFAGRQARVGYKSVPENQRLHVEDGFGILWPQATDDLLARMMKPVPPTGERGDFGIGARIQMGRDGLQKLIKESNSPIPGGILPSIKPPLDKFTVSNSQTSEPPHAPRNIPVGVVQDAATVNGAAAADQSAGAFEPGGKGVVLLEIFSSLGFGGSILAAVLGSPHARSGFKGAASLLVNAGGNILPSSSCGFLLHALWHGFASAQGTIAWAAIWIGLISIIYTALQHHVAIHQHAFVEAVNRSA